MKTAQRHFLVSIGGVREYFASKSGGEVTSEPSEAYDGGQKTPDVIGGNPMTGNVIVGRPYDPVRDQPVIRRLRSLVGSGRMRVSVQPTDTDFVPIGKPDVYPDALLVRVSAPEHDAASGEAGRFELEFKPAKVV